MLDNPTTGSYIIFRSQTIICGAAATALTESASADGLTSFSLTF